MSYTAYQSYRAIEQHQARLAAAGPPGKIPGSLVAHYALLADSRSLDHLLAAVLSNHLYLCQYISDCHDNVQLGVVLTPFRRLAKSIPKLFSPIRVNSSHQYNKLQHRSSINNQRHR